MKRLTVRPSARLTGTGEHVAHPALPSSKSVLNRALVIDALAHCRQGRFDTEWQRTLRTARATMARQGQLCDDSEAMLDWLTADTATLRTIDTGAAGTAMRFSTAVLALLDGRHTITGTERMRERPIGVLVDALRQIGATIGYSGGSGYPPLSISGTGLLRGGEVTMSGSVSSQYVSAMLMIGAMTETGLTIRLEGDIVSRPYIHMTLGLMSRTGARAAWTDERTLRVEPGGYAQQPLTLEADWSAASYWYETAALSPNPHYGVALRTLRRDDLQGDKAVAELFEALGVRTHYGTDTDGAPLVTLTKTDSPTPHARLDLSATPDLAQTLVAAYCGRGATFRFEGLSTLKIKETDRLAALQREMARLGYVLETDAESITWSGQRCQAEAAPVISTYRDHRMAMALAPLAIVAPGLQIDDPMVVTKSYPRFWHEAAQAGFLITEND